MEIKLNIYRADNKAEVEKTYTINGYDLMMGTVDDFVNIIDLEKLHDNVALAGMIVSAYKELVPLIMDVFPELTEEEYRRVKTSELIEVIKQIGSAIVESMGVHLPQGNQTASMMTSQLQRSSTM